jgi:hypothetical protein
MTAGSAGHNADKATAAYSGSPTDTIGRGATYVVVDLADGRAPVVAVHTIARSV